MEFAFEIFFGFMIGAIVVWAFIWFLKQNYGHKCPACRNTVTQGAIKCGSCGEALDQAIFAKAPLAARSAGRLLAMGLAIFAFFIVLSIAIGIFM
jgi:hypothetical protein